MSRPLRIEFSDAWYHVLSRGRRRESIFRGTKDYEIFLQTVRKACEFWHLRVKREDLFYSRRGHGNEARNVAICLARRLRGDRLKEIGAAFKIDRYSTVSSIVERMKVRIGRDETLRKRVDHLISTIQMSQEQT